MAQELAGFPFWLVEFDESGRRVGPEADQLVVEVGSWRLTDLFVFCQECSLDRPGTFGVYGDLLDRLRGLIQSEQFRPKRAFTPGVVGVFWRSTESSGLPSALAYGAIAPPATPGAFDPVLGLKNAYFVPEQHDALDRIAALLAEPPQGESELIRFNELVTGGGLTEFQQLLKRLAPSAEAGGAFEDDLPRVLIDSRVDPAEVIARLAGMRFPFTDSPSPAISDLSPLLKGMRLALRLIVAWEMKSRAGVIGRRGLGPLLDEIHTADARLRLQLAGHGLGARLAAYALLGFRGSVPSPLKSLTLIQGSLSSQVFSPRLLQDPRRAGTLAGKTARVDGPLVITYSKSDTAESGLEVLSNALHTASDGPPPAALASVLAQDGAQGVETVKKTISTRFDPEEYVFQAGCIYNINAGDVIRRDAPVSGAHADFAHAEVAGTLLAAAGLFTPDPTEPQPGDALAAGAAGGLNDPGLRQSANLPIDEEVPGHYIIELNLLFEGGIAEAEKRFRALIQTTIVGDVASARRAQAPGGAVPAVAPAQGQGDNEGWARRRELERLSSTYYHCLLSVREWRALLRSDEKSGGGKLRCIYRLWPDHLVEALIDRSVATVKADAARRSFDASGSGIVWAVVDSGIDQTHPHFHEFKTLTDETVALLHRDFTVPFDEQEESGQAVGSSGVELPGGGRPPTGPPTPSRVPGLDTRTSALDDPYGHGTHVAGIIAGGLHENLHYVPPDRRNPGTLSSAAPAQAQPGAPNPPPAPPPGSPNADPVVGPMTLTAPVPPVFVEAVPAPGAADRVAPEGSSGPTPGASPPGTAGAPRAVRDGPAASGGDAYRVFQKVFDYDVSGLRKSQKIEERSVPESSRLRGVAPNCRLVSLRVLREDGRGRASKVMKALQYVREVNGEGKVLVIHGVNLSIGYEFDAELFACGQSPLCTEVDRLVRTGVIVVTAAGNTGYGQVDSYQRKSKTGLSQTINDPGNADRAITVGSTHREAPHTYGVSFFSSKGPTNDGRLKPDLVAPGERITSCAVGSFRKEIPAAFGLGDEVAAYIDRNGTSMAAPHVSGAIAAFLSIRREFIQRPEDVKRIFLESAMSLGRERYFEGHGMVDLMKAIQSV